MKKLVIVGGGAAGFFAAINAKEANPNLDVVILERGKKVLQKVKVSGGGRCNVTNACFTPKELCEFYPRGNKELLGAFHKFMTGDVMQWFESRGVALKIETDNRVFPKSNTSETIINCFLNEVEKLHIKLKTNTNVITINKEKEKYILQTNTKKIKTNYLLITTGSNVKMWQILKQLGYSVVKPVPSLFTFKISDKKIENIAGIAVRNATVSVVNTNLKQQGALLITHWGLSGPVILKLSAWGALFLAKEKYQFKIQVNWLSANYTLILQKLKEYKKENAKKNIITQSPFKEIPKRLWEKLSSTICNSKATQWAQLSNKQLDELTLVITKTTFTVQGKSTFKEEFVTAGGVSLKEINFNRFESKLHQNLFFAGEVLDIDAVTGGFNFQNAWTGAYIAAKSIANINE